MPGTPATDGLLFGPTSSGKHYVSLYSHRGNHPTKSQWHRDVPPQDEYELFEVSDDSGWSDTKGNYWSLRNGGGSPLGTRDERIAKHPVTSNPHDPWHGYPASPAVKGPGDAPSDDLLDRWLHDRVITRAMHRRILRRRI